MLYSELIAEITDRTEVKKSHAKSVVDAMVSIITECAKKGGRMYPLTIWASSAPRWCRSVRATTRLPGRRSPLRPTRRFGCGPQGASAAGVHCPEKGN